MEIMLTCKACGHVMTILFNKDNSIGASRCSCCNAIYEVSIRQIAPSKYSEEELKRYSNQHRG